MKNMMKQILVLVVLALVCLSEQRQRRKKLATQKKRLHKVHKSHVHIRKQDGETEQQKREREEQEQKKREIDEHDQPILNSLKYHAFIDAGSSGTRLYIYVQKGEKYIVLIDNVKNSEVKLAHVIQNLGLKDKSKLEDQKKQQIDGLYSLANKFCQEIVDNQSKSQDKVNQELELTIGQRYFSCNTIKLEGITLLSTAGSRDEQIASHQKSEDKNNYDAEMKTTFTALENGISYKYKEVFPSTQDNLKVKVAVVSGRYEGMFGFLALAMKLKNDHGYLHKVCPGQTYGECLNKIVYYEVGGSSTQVAFTNPIEHKNKKLKSKLKAKSLAKGIVQINGNLQHLLANNELIYSRSFLGNGNNQLYDIYLKNAKCNSDQLIKGELKLEQCYNDMRRIVEPATDRTTGANGYYREQFQNIVSHMKVNSKHILFLNSNGAAGLLSGKSNADMFTEHPKIFTNFNHYIKEAGPLCNDHLDKSEKNYHLCQSGAIPLFVMEQLGLHKAELAVDTFSWTDGALYLSQFNFETAEAFNHVDTNDKENKYLSLIHHHN